MSELRKLDIRLHGYRVVYRIGGDLASGRPVLIFVHGVAGSSGTWNQAMRELAPRYTVIAPDLLGHGQSDKPRFDYSLGGYANLLRDLMFALDIDRATFVGHSLGGGIAMQLAYQHPQRVERIVLVASGGLGPDVSWLLRAVAVPGAEYLMPVLFPSVARRTGSALGRALYKVGLRRPDLEQSWRSYAALTDPGDRYAFVRTMRSVVDLGGQMVSAHDRLYLSSRLPTLIVWGRRDRIIPVEHATVAHEAIPGSRLVVFGKSGHFPYAEEPDRFVDVLTEFIESSEPMHLDEREWRAVLTSPPPREPDEGPAVASS